MLILERQWTSQPQVALLPSAGLGRGLVAYGTGASDGLWTPVNAPTKSATPQGIARKFVAASTQYVRKDLVVSTPLTLFALARPTSVSVNQALVSVGAATADRHLLYLGSGGNVLMFSGAGGTTGQATGTSSAILANNYYSCVGRVVAANSRQSFLNGTQTGATNTTTVSPAASSVCAAGAYWSSGAATAGFYFGGDIAVWGVWNRALSDAEIYDLYVNPWRMFEPIRLYIPPAVAAATAPTITALSAINITATSAQPRISYS